jgi:hypothetical protein
MVNLTRRIAVLSVMALAIGVGSMFAQSDRGTITGTVTDSSGARVAGATVNITDTLTGINTNLTSNTDGNYTVSNLPIGTYSVNVEHAGFKKYTQQGITLSTGQTLGVDVVLQVGNITETVQVTSEAPQLEAETTVLSTTATATLVQDLPLVSQGEMRNPGFFMVLDSSVSSRGASFGGGGGFNNRSLTTTVAGAPSAAAEFQVDGAILGDGEQLHADFRLIGFPQDAVQEFNLMTTSVPAEFGHSGGGITAFTIKSGTNSMHGTAYDYFRNNALDARGYFSPTVSPLHQNEFGATWGGHIIKNKLFAFGWYDGFRLSGSATPGLTTVPDQQELQGNFSGFQEAVGPGGTLANVPIYEPGSNAPDGMGGTTRTQFPGNIISPTMFDKVAAAYNPLYPSPNHGSQQYNNEVVAGANSLSQNEYGAKVDFQLSAKNRISGSFSYSSSTAAAASSPFPGVLSETGPSINKLPWVRLSDDYLLTPSIENHITLGFNRWGSGSESLYGVAGGWPAKLGYTGVPWSDGAIPIINGFDGVGQFGGNGGNPSIDDQNNFDVNENLSWVKGKHTLKFGMEFLREGSNSISTGRSSGYLFTANKLTGLPDSATAPNCYLGYTNGVSNCAYGSTDGSGFASFLLGQMDSGETRNYIAPTLGNRGGYWGAYAQDDWKVSSKLTANLGVRWDMYEPSIEVHNNAVWMSPTAVNPDAGGLLGASVFATPAVRAGSYAAKHDFSPRIGLAYQINNKTVVRASYGILFGSAGQDGTAASAFNPGYLDYNLTNNDNDYTPTWVMANGWPSGPGPGQLFPLTLTKGPTFQLGSSAERLDPGDSRPPYMQSRVFQIERQLPSNMLLKIAYVGSRGTRLQSHVDVKDEMPPQDLSLTVPSTTGCLVGCTLLPAFQQSFSSPAVQALSIVQAMPTIDPATGHHTPFAGFEALVPGADLGQALKPFPQYTGMGRLYEGDGTSDYESLQVNLDKRMSNGLTLLVSYTWEKTLTNAASNFADFSGPDENSYDARAQKGLSINDYPMNLVITYSYELPFGPGKKFLSTGGAAGKIVGGWKVAGVQNYQSGPPQLFTEPCELGEGNDFTGNNINGGGFSCRPNMAVGVSIKNPARNQPGFNPTTMSLVNPAAFKLTPNPVSNPGLAYQSYFGNMTPALGGGGRRLPYMDEDISVIKSTKITERVSVDFRADFLNIFNRTVFGLGTGGDMYGSSLNNQIGGGPFGIMSSQSNTPREIQFGLKINY